MSEYKFELNKKALYNYSFFCPDCGLHLDLLRPVATIELEELTPSILRGLRAGTLIDVNESIILDKCAQCGYAEVSSGLMPLSSQFEDDVEQKAQASKSKKTKSKSKSGAATKSEK